MSCLSLSLSLSLPLLIRAGSTSYYSLQQKGKLNLDCCVELCRHLCDKGSTIADLEHLYEFGDGGDDVV